MAPSSLSRSISIATNQPRKPGVTSWPSPAVPEDGTSQSPCWGRRCPLQVSWVPQMPLGALGAEGHVPAPTPTVVSMKGNSEERGININELICTERLSLIPQPARTPVQEEGC